MNNYGKLPTLTEAAKGEAYFECYSDNSLWYSLVWADSEQRHTLQIPIPSSDAVGGHFTPTMRGITLLRWVRKEISRIKEENEMIAEAKRQHEANLLTGH